jgi:hypothetical protein
VANALQVARALFRCRAAIAFGISQTLFAL